MTALIGLSDDTILTVVRAWLLDVLPSGDATFSGVIAGDVLTPGTITGTLGLGDELFSENVAPGTLILEDNGDDTFTVSISQTCPPSGPSEFFANGVGVYQAQINRVPEPKESDYVLVTPGTRQRIATTADTFEDAAFTGTIAGKILTVTAIMIGAIKLGATLFGVDVPDGLRVLSYGSATDGGIGTYNLTAAATLPVPQKIASGQMASLEATEYTIDLDVHGPRGADIAQIITTLFRDDNAVRFIEAMNPNISPLYADEARQLPFPNQEQQWEDRWRIELHLQINPEIRTPMQGADQLAVTTIEVDAVYPVS